MNVKFEVERLSYTIKRFQTFSRCIAIAGQYSLLVDQLPKKEHRYPVDLLEDPERLKFTNTESTANAPAQFLLENLFIIDT